MSTPSQVVDRDAAFEALSPGHHAIHAWPETHQLPGLLARLESGSLDLVPVDRDPESGDSALDILLRSHGFDVSFPAAQPLADYLAGLGQDPFAVRPTGTSAYQELALRPDAALPMAWCLSLSCAPPLACPDVPSQIHQDRVLAHAQGADASAPNFMVGLDRAGVDLFASLPSADPLALVVDRARPRATPLRVFGVVPAKARYWERLMGNLCALADRAVVRGTLAQALACRALSWAWAGYAASTHTAKRPPAWLTPFQQVDRALAARLGWKQVDGALTDRAHAATLDYLLAQPGFGPIRLALENQIGRQSVGSLRAQPLPQPELALLDLASRLAPRLEALGIPLGQPVEGEGDGTWAWEPWSVGFRRATAPQSPESTRHAAYAHPGIWALGLPAMDRACYMGLIHLERALAQGNAPPHSPCWADAFSRCPWSARARATLLNRALPGARTCRASRVRL